MERADFPVFRAHPDLVYLDSGATTQKPNRVIESLTRFYEQGTAGVHRAVYSLGERVTGEYEEARTRVAALIGAASDDIVFTSGTTASLNLAASVWSRAFLKPGDTILCTELEHHSNLLPWREAAEAAGAKVIAAPVGADADLDLKALEGLLTQRPQLLALTLVNNALGVVPPIERILEMARRFGVPVALDAAQAGAHIPIDVKELGCVFLALSGHKMYAPEGSGSLYISPEIRDRLGPWQTGGGMVLRVTGVDSVWQEGVARFEAGTQATGPQIAFGTAARLLMETGLETIRNREADLIKKAVETLRGIPGVSVIGDPKQRTAAVPFNLNGVHPHDLCQYLDAKEIAVRSGFHCAQPLFQALDLPSGCCRASFGCYNTEEDVRRLAEALAEAGVFFSN